MPLYFAYGANMDREAMRLRCPNSRPLGRARLARHKFFIMGPGYASVKCNPRLDVHGVLYDLALSDVSGLDRYEEVGRRLYSKQIQPVLREGSSPVRALVYVGASQAEGRPEPAYIRSIVAAAKEWALPETYVAYLASFDAEMELTPPRWRAIKLEGT